MVKMYFYILNRLDVAH